jgi:Na+-translocating ferredoxin:NAD+ oxidoreductase RNF subunit RnfB
MSGIITAVVSVTAIGLLCAVMLAVASKVMAVKTDERAERIREKLPGANCGACGYPGCDGYAAALVDGNGVRTNLCIPGGDAVSREISEILGVAFEEVQEKVAVVHCCGDNTATRDRMNYEGINTCQACKLLYGGKGSCTYGCMGFGDCAAVCPEGAICIENGLARVDTRLCTGCGLCAAACPNGIITIEPDAIRQAVMCSNKEKGAVTRQQCSRGCIACKRCERECPAGAIVVTDNVAVIDYDKCTACGKCVQVCPVKCITEADFRGVNSRTA